MYTCLEGWAIGVHRPFRETADLAAEYGFGGVGMDLEYLREHGPEAYRAVLDERDLEPGSFGLPFRFDADEAEYEKGLAELEDVAELAAAVGCERASTYVLPASDEREFEENFAFHRERLEPIAAILDDQGVDLGLEFVGPETARESSEYEFVSTAEGMLELCDAVGDNVGLLLDAWHWHTGDGDPETLRSLDREDVVDVHVNDAPAGLARSEYVDDDRRLPAETGVIDIGTFLGELDRMGYDGPVAVEPFSDEVEAMDDEAAVAATKAALDAAWDRAGL